MKTPLSSDSRLRIRLDRKSRFTLTAQVTEALRQIIAGGVLKPGDRLPSHLALAKQLGVSTRVIRESFDELSRLGYVEVRPRLGCRVLSPGKGRIGGAVLFVSAESMASAFWTGVLVRELRRRLRRWGCSFVEAYVGTGTRAYVELDEALKRPLAVVLVSHDDSDVMERVSRSGIPFVILGTREYAYPSYRGLIRSGCAAAVPDFVRHCIRAGVRHVVQVGFGDSIDAVPALRAAGVKAEWLLVKPRGGCSVREGVGLAALDVMYERYSKPGAALPDVFFLTDDCLAVGALSALNLLGVRSPDDVKIAVFQVAGDGLVYQKSLTRVEQDPKADAATVARGLKCILDGKPLQAGLFMASRYVFGETFPALM